MQSSCQQAQDTTSERGNGAAGAGNQKCTAKFGAKSAKAKGKVKVKASVCTCHSCATGGLAGEERRKKNEEYGSKNKDENKVDNVNGINGVGPEPRLGGPF